MAILALSFLPQLATGKLVARDDKGWGGASMGNWLMDEKSQGGPYDNE
jgi:hypothetical protein